MSHRLVSAYAVRLVEVDVSCAGAGPRPRRRVDRFLGVFTNDGNVAARTGSRCESRNCSKDEHPGWPPRSVRTRLTQSYPVRQGAVPNGRARLAGGGTARSGVWSGTGVADGSSSATE